MFTAIGAKNFKGWRHLPDLPLSPVTGLFGTNSSGKTSLLQLLLLLKQTATSTDRAQALQLGDDRTVVELGSFRDLVHEHDMTQEIEIRAAWSTPQEIKFSDPETVKGTLFETGSFDFSTSVSADKSGRMEVDRFQYLMDEASVSLTRSTSRHGRKDPEYNLEASIQGRADYLRRVQGRAWPLPNPVKCYGFPDEAVAYYQNSGFVGDLELELERQFTNRTFYLGPLRETPLRQYRWKGTHPDDVGPAGDRAVEALLASRERGKQNARAFNARGHAKRRITVEEHVAAWLLDLGLVTDFDVERLSAEADIYRVRVRRTPHSTPVYLTDVGFGVSQVLPVLVLLAYAPAGSTVILEQPEIHLHPSVQSGLADVILEAATVRSVQVLVESHSEHLLRRLQLRIAEEKASADDVALYFCDANDDGSTAQPLNLNVLGEIENWPKGFFGDPLGETAAIAKAGLRRRLRD
jgi:predicted ATPase